MQEPAALDRARALARHVKYLGVHPSEYAVTVSAAEGFELLGWYLWQIDASCRDLYQRDLTEAQRSGSPFTMLDGFELFGLPIRALN